MKLKDRLKSYYMCIRFPFLKVIKDFRFTQYRFENYNKAYDDSGKIINRKIAFKLSVLDLYQQIISIFPTKYCWFDAIPKGWRDAFGIKLCKEIKKSLKKSKSLYKVKITNVKEKWGYLHIYCNTYPGDLLDIINKYGLKSKNICISCGEPAKFVTLNWISPYCETCLDYNKRYQNISEFYGKNRIK